MGYAEPDGPRRWRARWEGPDGRIKSKSGFTRKRDAADYADDQEAAIRAGRYIDPAAAKTTIGEYWRQWFPAQDRADNTLRSYRQHYDRYIEPRWGRVEWGEVAGAPLEMQQWLKNFRAEVGPSTYNTVTSVLSGMAASAVFSRIIGASPMPPVERGRTRDARPPDKRRGRLVGGLSLIDAERVGARLCLRDRLITRLATWTGMRYSEAHAVRRTYLSLSPATEDRPACGHYVVDPDYGAVHRGRAAERKGAPPKSGGGRILDLPPFLVEQLLDYIETIPEEQDHIFVSRNGHPVQYRDFAERWRPACDGREAYATPTGTGRPAIEPICFGVTFHATKHLAAWILDELGVRQNVRNYRLGHLGAGVGSRYAAEPTAAERATLMEGQQQMWLELQSALGDTLS